RQLMSTSTNGGKTWGAAKSPSGTPQGLGGQPLVRPNGTVVVPFEDLNGTISAFTSTNGGSSWNAPVTVATIDTANDGGSMRTSPLPSAEIDGSGKVYVAWQDCRFEKNCSANDIVYSTSSDGTHWSAVQRVASDPVNSGIDHFIPGFAVDKSTSGSSAHLAVTYYYFPIANCGSNCTLDVGYSSSTDGGAHWTANTQLAGPMQTTWLANTTQGRMVGDYISTSISSDGRAHPVFALAKKPLGTTFNEAMYTVTGGLPVIVGTNTSSTVVVGSGHAPALSRHTAL
ncbi:MAG TPA: exo-alpha-sialidase, partial [Ktedonobacter sp.]|nr:exo-alpha-sialidase [Ktedonobacter sp.]